MGFLQPRIKRVFTNRKRLRRRISLPVLFVFIWEIRGSSVQRLEAWTPGLPFGDAAHAMAIEFYKRYLMTGGMPEVVAADAAGA
jgi:hypothetical protein